MIYKKKLIEVALPLDAINKASAREKSIRHGHPSTLHLWWARRPLAAARAVIFSQMVDDPSGYTETLLSDPNKKRAAIRELGTRKGAWDERKALYEEACRQGDPSIAEPGPEPTLQDCVADIERERLFRIIEDLVLWENTTNEKVLQQARDEIWQSWRRTCAENADHPQAKELFDRHKLPAFHDPFAGGGALPLEAQRLGLEAYASDLNPVAVLINKAMIEIPPKFAGKPPVNPDARNDQQLFKKTWKGAQGLAEDVKYYGKWMRDEAEKRIGHLYPKIEITTEMAKERSDLKSLVGKKLTVIAWLWTHTVKSPNPAFAQVDVPLVGSFSLSAKKGKEAWIDPVIRSDGIDYDFKVRLHSTPRVKGTIDRNGGICLMSGTPMPFEYIRNEAQNGRMGQRLMAIVAETDGKKIYLPPNRIHEKILDSIQTEDGPDGAIPEQALGIRVQLYGINEYAKLFNRRQKLMLHTLAQLIRDVAPVIAKLPDSSQSYSEAVQTYLSLAMGRYADYGSMMTYWDDRGPSIQKTYGLPTLQMRWSYPETNPFIDFSGNLYGMIEGASTVLDCLIPGIAGHCWQADATASNSVPYVVISTDPPYYDNIGYAALSDYFYIWLKLALRATYPDLFATILTPKDAELIAEPGRHGSRDKAAQFFEEHFANFACELLRHTHPAFPSTIYYAFKQAELGREGSSVASTGWEVFLSGLIQQGWEVLGTWPIRTEQTGGLRLVGRNSLASSIVLVCRPRASYAVTASRREFLTTLKSELPIALAHLQRGNIAPVDLAQAAIGPGMAIYTHYARVIDAEGKPLTVRDALALINQTLDEVLAAQEGDFDADSRLAIAWFEQYGFSEGEYGVAEVLSKAKNTSISGMVEARIMASGHGKVRLLRPNELPADWDPTTDKRLTAWEGVHHLIRVLEKEAEPAAAALVTKLGSKAEIARELAYRLYTLCERKKRTVEALSYNGLVQSWPEIMRLAREGDKSRQVAPGLFDEKERG